MILKGLDSYFTQILAFVLTSVKNFNIICVGLFLQIVWYSTLSTRTFFHEDYEQKILV